MSNDKISHYTAQRNILGARKDKSTEQVWEGPGLKPTEQAEYLLQVLEQRLDSHIPLPVISSEESDHGGEDTVAVWGHRTKGLSCAVKVYFPTTGGAAWFTAEIQLAKTKEMRKIRKAGLTEIMPMDKAETVAAKSGVYGWNFKLGDVHNQQTWQEINRHLQAFRETLDFAQTFTDEKAGAEQHGWGSVEASLPGTLAPQMQSNSSSASSEDGRLRDIPSMVNNATAQIAETLHRAMKRFRKVWRTAGVPIMAVGAGVSTLATGGATRVLGMLGLAGLGVLLLLSSACVPKVEVSERLEPEAVARLTAINDSLCIDPLASSTPHTRHRHVMEQADAIADCIRTECDENTEACAGWSEEWTGGRDGEVSPVPWVLRHCLPTNRPGEPMYRENQMVSRCLDSRYEEDLAHKVNKVFADNSA